jgi:predicted amidohydrolase YtcJ
MPTLFHNAAIRTLGASGVVPALLCDDAGTILALGHDAERHPLAATARREDLGGRTVLPGPVDAHVHLLMEAEGKLHKADLMGSRSVDDVLGRLTAHSARKPDGWIVGRGFDQELFPTPAFPTRGDLDRVASDRPILISRVCGHAVVANSLALRMAGVESETGILTEDRMDPVFAVIPDPSLDDWIAVARHAMDMTVAAGFTGVHVLVLAPEEVAAFQALHREGALKCRVRLHLPYRMLKDLAAIGLSTGFGDDWLSIGAIKIFSDGAMGPSTAAMSVDYADSPGNKGEFIYPPETLTEMCKEVHNAGCQLVIHAIGDAAVDACMDGMVAAAGADIRKARHRIEHASIVRPDQIQRLAETGIVCCVQPQFTVTDFWTVRRLGAERKSWIYPFATMLKAGCILSGGTDSPVEKLDALEAIGRAVTRDAPWRGEDRSEGYLESECLTVEQAWDLFTKGSAYSGFHEHKLGTLEPGMLCDFIALDEDPFAVEPRRVETMQPAVTVVGGKVFTP